MLKQFGISQIEQGMGKTGVVAVLENGKGKSIGLRADMDALPIHEENSQKKYKSKTFGKMRTVMKSYNYVIRSSKIFS